MKKKSVKLVLKKDVISNLQASKIIGGRRVVGIGAGSGHAGCCTNTLAFGSCTPTQAGIQTCNCTQAPSCGPNN